MKRCSECDFIYEDEQNLCDMDGHELVSDPTLHPKVGSATTPGRSRSSARRLALAVAIAALLGALLSVGYSGLTREEEPQTTKAPPIKVNLAPKPISDLKPATPNPSPATPALTPTPSPVNSPRLEKTRAKPNTASPFAKSTPLIHPNAPGRETLRSESVKSNHRKDSGIGGFLKKTGKILKKPFKF